jgi:histidine ammonia-lyase
MSTEVTVRSIASSVADSTVSQVNTQLHANEVKRKLKVLIKNIDTGKNFYGITTFQIKLAKLSKKLFSLC